MTMAARAATTETRRPVIVAAEVIFALALKARGEITTVLYNLKQRRTSRNATVRFVDFGWHVRA
jgi:hypothetical protein